ncbi:MAG TPA: 3-oxosteroid 1-dehydrogenase [Micromonosporaceae bacterium]|nr:3-oxosteroid 1-dehydrogenase [Micromonosporaceae bacterium]
MTADGDEFDVVVVGSGAAGMTAALTAAHHGLRVVVLEKAGTFGGSTARSGGGVWVPGNEVLRRAGVVDTAAQARAYLAHVVGDDVPVARQRALLDHGPAMLSFVRAHAGVDFAWVPNYADYYPEAPGGLARGRTVEPVPLDGRPLGAELANLAPPYLKAPNGITITAADYRWLSLGTHHPRAVLAAARVTIRGFVSRVLLRRPLSMGQALVAGLRLGLRDTGVPVWLNTPMIDLHTEDSRVAGVWVVARAGAPAPAGATKAEAGTDQKLVRARYGVVLCSGGFEHNGPMRRQHQRAPIGTEWTVGAAGNTGDGIEAGRRLGAALDLMDDAWWGPTIPLPGGPYFCLAERSLPGCLMVNGAGTRFVNEAAPYVDAVHAMYDKHTAEVPHIPAWLVADQRYRDRYLFAGRGPRQPLPRRWYASKAAHRAPTLDELAARIGVPAEALSSTVDRFNGFARTGRDEDFGRGDSVYDRYYGDPRNRPNPCLGQLTKPPFYAVRIVPGDLGTKGGLRTDERARVLREDGTPIPGLYAAGNASAAVMGRSYAGAGATIGPAMTFGYLAALDLAGARDRDSTVEV